MSSFSANFPLLKKYKKQTHKTEKLRKTLGNVKAAFKMLVKSTPGLNFTNIFIRSFYSRSSQKRKNSVKSSVSFYAFGIYRRKSCS